VRIQIGDVLVFERTTWLVIGTTDFGWLCFCLGGPGGDGWLAGETCEFPDGSISAPRIVVRG